MSTRSQLPFAYALIKKRMRDGWADACASAPAFDPVTGEQTGTGLPVTTLVFQNEGYNGEVDDQSGLAKPYLYFEILGGPSRLVGLGEPGQRVVRRYGTIFVHVSVPALTEGDTAVAYAVAAGDIFDNQDFGGVQCEDASVDRAGTETEDDKDGIYYRKSVSVPFYFDDMPT